MSKGLMFFLGTLAGGLIGSLTTWYVCKKSYNEDLEEARKAISGIIEKSEKREPKVIKDVSDKPTVNKDKEVPANDMYNYVRLVDSVNYTSYSEKEEARKASEESPSEEPDEPIILKNENEYGMDPSYEIATLQYYIGDGTLVLEDEELTFDPIVTIGEEAVRLLRSGTPVLYVANSKTGYEYEVFRVEGYSSIGGD